MENKEKKIELENTNTKDDFALNLNDAMSGTIIFDAERYEISKDSLCLDFGENSFAVLDFENMHILTFKTAGKEYTYEKVKNK